MLVRCPSCSAKFNVPDEKVVGKRARMKCKKCDGVILIDGTTQDSATLQAPAPSAASRSSHPPQPRPALTPSRWEVAEPSGKRHVMTSADVELALRGGTFEPGTLVRGVGSTSWAPPYDVPQFAQIPAAAPAAPPPVPAAPVAAPVATPPAALDSAPRSQQLTFSDETVSLGVAESAALSREAFAVEQRREESGTRPASSSHHAAPAPSAPQAAPPPSAPHHVAPELMDASGFDDDEAATVVRSLDQLNQLREMAKAPSKQPTLKPPSPAASAQVPFAASPAPVPVAARKRHNPTLLGVPAPAVNSAPSPEASAPSQDVESPAAAAIGAAPTAELGAPAQPAAPAAARAPSAVSTAPPPPSSGRGPLAERPTEAAPAPAELAADWVNSSRLPALSSPAVPRLAEPTGPLSPGSGPLSPGSGPLSPGSGPLSLDAQAPQPSSGTLSLPGLAPPSAEAFTSQIPPRSSSLGWVVSLVFLLIVGAGLGALYFYRPQIFFAGRDRLVALTHQAIQATGLGSAAPSRVDGPAFDTPSAGAVLERAAQQAPSCAEPGGPTGRGRVKVLYQQDGRALNAVVSAPFHETQVGRCLVGLFKSTQVPAFGGEPVIVSKTFTVR